jgi:hypothetical protein
VGERVSNALVRLWKTVTYRNQRPLGNRPTWGRLLQRADFDLLLVEIEETEIETEIARRLLP